MSNTEFIASLVAGAQQGYSTYGVLPSITIAQAIHESGWGTSSSAKYDKNLFGIKMPGAKPPGMTITQGSYATDDGGYYRRYQSWGDSVVDHGYFLANNSRYSNIIGNTDYISVAHNLQKDGYATDSAYASKLINTIESNNLTQYDTGSPGTSGVGSSSASGSTSDISTGATIDIPETNYGVISGSEQSGDILYGRRYRIIVSNLDGTKALDVSELKCTFNCIKIILSQPQYSIIVIYNLSPETENTIINEGCRVVLEAGYEGSQYGVIFDGNVVQSIRNKENGTTYTLTLVAADGDMWMSYSLSAFSMVRGQNSRSIIESCASKATIPTELGNISSTLSESKLTRGKVVFGLTKDYLRQLAQSENATLYMEDGKINIIKAEDIPEGEIIELSPSSGLIGVPVQKDYGVTIKCLLNPKIKINSMVHIDNSLVRNQQYEQGQQLYSLDKDGIYRVVQLTHMGDTRGNDWYTEVETVTQAGKLPAMATNSGQYTWG